MHSKKIFYFLLVLFPLSVQAHLIGGNGFSSGFFHPFFGIDHLLAMIAVGIMGYRFGKKNIFALPLVFVSFMVFGGLTGFTGLKLPLVETMIAVSLLVFGALVSFSKKIPTSIAIACIALFAFFHGHAHGQEIPLIANQTLYILGFMSSTFFLHLTGIIICFQANKTIFFTKLFKITTAITSAIGLILLI